MDKDSAKYAEPIWAVELDEPRDGISFFGAALLMMGAGLAVAAVGVTVVLIFSLERAPQSDLRVQAYTIQQSDPVLPLSAPVAEVSQ